LFFDYADVIRLFILPRRPLTFVFFAISPLTFAFTSHLLPLLIVIMPLFYRRLSTPAQPCRCYFSRLRRCPLFRFIFRYDAIISLTPLRRLILMPLIFHMPLSFARHYLLSLFFRHIDAHFAIFVRLRHCLYHDAR